MKALSMREINQSDEVLIWFKGPLLYKNSKSGGKFVFPWNVNKIKLTNQSFFPVSFWGIKGYQKLNIEDIAHDVIKWDADSQWSTISKNSDLENFDETAITNAIHQAIPESIKTLNIFKEKTNIKFTIPDILDTTKEVIPQSILKTKINF